VKRPAHFATTDMAALREMTTRGAIVSNSPAGRQEKYAAFFDYLDGEKICYVLKQELL